MMLVLASIEETEVGHDLVMKPAGYLPPTAPVGGARARTEPEGRVGA